MRAMFTVKTLAIFAIILILIIMTKVCWGSHLKPVKVGICGLGTVGSGTFNVLTRNKSLIAARAGRDIVIEQVGVRNDNHPCDTTGIKVVRDIFNVATHPDIDIVR